MANQYSKSTKIEQVIIPSKYIREFARALMVGTQELDSWDNTNWTFKQKQAFKFAIKLVKKYA